MQWCVEDACAVALELFEAGVKHQLEEEAARAHAIAEAQEANKLKMAQEMGR